MGATVRRAGTKKKKTAEPGDAVRRDTWPVPPPQSGAVAIHDTIPTPPPEGLDDVDDVDVPTLRGVDVERVLKKHGLE